jgi:hypothetical protein
MDDIATRGENKRLDKKTSKFDVLMWGTGKEGIEETVSHWNCIVKTMAT